MSKIRNPMEPFNTEKSLTEEEYQTVLAKESVERALVMLRDSGGARLTVRQRICDVLKDQPFLILFSALVAKMCTQRSEDVTKEALTIFFVANSIRIGIEFLLTLQQKKSAEQHELPRLRAAAEKAGFHVLRTELKERGMMLMPWVEQAIPELRLSSDSGEDDRKE